MGSNAAVLFAADVDFDGRPEILLSGADGTELNVFDTRLRQIGCVSPGRAGIEGVELLSFAPRRRGLALHMEDEIVLMQPVSVTAPPWRAGSEADPRAAAFGRQWGLWLAFAAGLGLAALMWGAARARRTLGSLPAARELVSELKIVRHGARLDGQSQEPVRRLLSALRTCAEEDGAGVGRAMLRESGLHYREQVAPALGNILRLAATIAPLPATLGAAREAGRFGRQLRPLLDQVGEPVRLGPGAGGPAVGVGAAGVAGAGTALAEGARSGAALAGDHAVWSASCAAAAGTLAKLESLLRQIETGALARVSCDPVAETGAACHALRPSLERDGVELAGLEVSGSLGARAFIEAAALRRCLHDLIQNSIEACREAARPRVRIRIACGERQVVVQVCDNGSGVPPANWESIFHGESTKSPPGGRGLSQARRVVESYSGRLFVRASEPWGETVMEVELCRAPS